MQFGVMLFLMAAGLTLIFGVMGLINLAHGSLFMVGAFACAAVAAATGSFWLGLVASLAAAAAAGAVIEILVIRRLYDRDHLDQVLATFALILIFSEGTRWVFGSFPLYLDIPPLLSGAVRLPGGASYPLYRLAVIGVGVAVAVGLYLLISRTRLGMRIRAGESDREMIAALGVDIRTLYTLVFALGAALAGLAGALVGALQSVQVGMGEPVLILAFVVIVIGGIGSIKGALIGSLLVGVTETLGRFLLPRFFAVFIEPSDAAAIGAAIASMLIYIVMALVLAVRPQGLFSANG
nr:branched-chain amino acid ABC transporter permease [Nitratireductor luteus]